MILKDLGYRKITYCLEVHGVKDWEPKIEFVAFDSLEEFRHAVNNPEAFGIFQTDHEAQLPNDCVGRIMSYSTDNGLFVAVHEATHAAVYVLHEMTDDEEALCYAIADIAVAFNRFLTGDITSPHRKGWKRQ